MITIEVRAESMGRVPSGFTGVTYTNGRQKPFAAWINGQIISYWAKEGNAITAIERA
jgi:hypothetical protein